MDPTRLLLFIAFLGGLLNILLFVTADRSIQDPLTLQELQADAGLIDIAASDSHACGIGAAGRVWCWGNGEAGQLGHGRFVSSPTPVPVTALPDPAIAIDVFGATSCAVLETGTTWCWGNSTSGQIGLPYTTPATAFPQQMEVDLSHLVSVGGTSVCTSAQAGGSTCWGDVLSQDENGRIFMTNPGIFTPFGGDTFYRALDSGLAHHCAITLDGDVTCWGNTSKGEAGIATRPLSSRWAVINSAQRVELDDQALFLATGTDHSCAILTDNSLWCWGDKRGYSPRGDTHSGTPTKVADISAPQGLAGGDDMTCFTDTPYTYCLGKDSLTPWLAFPPTTPEMTQIDAGGEQICGIDINGGGWCSSTDSGIRVAGLRPTDWRPDNSASARWSRMAGWWAQTLINKERS